MPSTSDYERHCRAAYEIPREYFSYDVVLPRLLQEVGVARAQEHQARAVPYRAGIRWRVRTSASR